MTNDFNLDEYEAKLLLRMPAFREGISAMRKQWGIPANGFKNNKARHAWRDHITETNMETIKESIRILAKNVGYSERWQGAIYMHLLTNNRLILRIRQPYIISYKPIRKDPTGDDGPANRKDVTDVYIRVFADTTEREVRAALKETKDMFELKYRKKQLYEYADRDIAALDKHEEGMSNAEISGWLADNGYGHHTANDVAKYLRHIKRRLQY